jgi:hypothetical protein
MGQAVSSIIRNRFVGVPVVTPTYVPEDKKTLFAFFAFFAD